MNQEKDVDIYEMITRGGGIFLAVMLWIISMRFSVDGFKISVQDDAWIGWILGFMVTYLQIMFNRGAPNKTLHMAGVIAYIYGMTTNLIGILELRGGALATWEALSVNPLSGLLQIGVVLTLAAAVEVIPEHLMIYCIRQDGEDGDFIDSLFRGMPKKSGSRTGFSVGKKSKPQGGRGNGDNRSNDPRGGKVSGRKDRPMSNIPGIPRQGGQQQRPNPRNNVTITNMED